MMMKASLLTTAACLALSSVAVADYVEINGTYNELDDGVTVWGIANVYAMFDDEFDSVLNIYNSDVTTADAMGFHHNDVAGGSWKPSFSLDLPPTFESAYDSYVTVGYGVGAAAALNGTALDPGFNPTGGIGPFIPFNAGWYNGDPLNPQIADDAAIDGLYGVHVGQFVWDSSRVTPENMYPFFSFYGEVGYKDSDGTTGFGDGSYVWEIPAPGALALLALGGIVARRRRA